MVYTSYEQTRSLETEYIAKRIVYKYKYNKAGSMIEETQTSEGYNETLTFKYDELGERITD